MAIRKRFTFAPSLFVLLMLQYSPMCSTINAFAGLAINAVQLIDTSKMSCAFAELTQISVMEQLGQLRYRTYGRKGCAVIALHGGPAAVGSVAALARGLSETFRVIEPWQRGSGDAPLTVQTHVEDLHALVTHCCGDERPALVGWSWGAMLALAFAAAYPDSVGPLALIGCGAFDKVARARFKSVLAERTDADLKARLDDLDRLYPDPAKRMTEWARLILPLYIFERDPSLPEDELEEPFDERAHVETWEDMLRLQKQGVYPQSFSAIKSPVLMIHGDYDPHPGPMIRDGLKPYLPQLEYQELARCGHTPWIEKHAREGFFRKMREWLLTELSS